MDEDTRDYLQHAYNALCGAIGSLKMIREAPSDELADIAWHIENLRSRLAPIAFYDVPHIDGFSGSAGALRPTGPEVAQRDGSPDA